jgi:putative peptide zinc metalloprotease protein
MYAKLRGDLAFIEQVYRGETSFVVKDLTAAKYFRFRDVEVRVMRLFDGKRSPQDVVLTLAEQGIRIGVSAVEGFARKLSTAGFLERTVAERSTLQLERLRAERHKRRRPALFRGEVLRMRWSFGNPDALLSRILPHIRWMFTPVFLGVSVVLFATYLAILGYRHDEYTAALRASYTFSTITFGNVVILWFTGLTVILIHELGHGFTCKYYGGEVRELGFMLLFFQPAFYCNVSDAWSFPELRARLWVTAAGSWIQLVVAGIAAIAWWAAMPGTLVSQIAAAAMLIGGALTLLTNMNPLLPLDGYFALTDWLEIPNLRIRALEHFNWWIKRHVFRIDVSEPNANERERRIFLIYGALAAGYISFVFVLVANLVIGWAQRFFGGIGVAAALFAIVLMTRKSIVEWARTAALAVRSRRAPLRGAPWRKWVIGAAVVLPVVLFLPWTLTTSGDLVVQPSTSRTIAAPDSGVVAQVFVVEGVRVPAGAPVVRLVDRGLERDLLVATRAVDSLAVAESAARAVGRIGDAERLTSQQRAALAAVASIETRLSRLTLRALTSGIVATQHPDTLVGRRVRPRDSLLALASLDSVEVRIALKSAGATRVQQGQVVHLVSYADASAPWTGRVVEVSAAGVASERGAVEARVRLAAGGPWRAGAHGEASVELQRSTVLGAIWWKLRQRVRGDLLL